MGKKPTMSKKRIGILLTNSQNEGKKEEIISLRRRVPPRPWIKDVDFVANPDFRIERAAYQLQLGNKVPKTIGVATDVSIGEYLKMYHGDIFEVDYIRPREISKERLSQNDINFIIIYDLLESFHIDRSRGKKVYHKLLDAVRSSDNIFPNWELQEFISSKLLYYNYFKQVGIPIVPTHTLTRDEFTEQISLETASGGDEGAADRVIATILAKIESENWGKFIAKPVLGQESKACRTFRPGDSLQKMFTKYVVTTLKKYPGLIFQKFIKGFGKSVEVPEIRTYWVGQEYQFSMVATKQKIYCLAGEGGKPQGRKQNGVMRLPKLANLETLKNIAKRVIDVLQTKITKSPDGVALPLLMTRVDMGVMQDGDFKPWVNEVEYVPSYYVEDHTHPIEKTVAKQCVVIVKKFLGIESISDFELSLDCVESPSKKHITLEDDPILKCAVSSSRLNDLDNSVQMDNPPVLVDLPTSPILNTIPTAELYTEPDADMCMDISFVDT